MADKMEITIMPGGVIKIVTDPISAENHVNAEEFVKFIARKAGGETEVTKRTDAHHEHDTHEHEHEHN